MFFWSQYAYDMLIIIKLLTNLPGAKRLGAKRLGGELTIDKGAKRP